VRSSIHFPQNPLPVTEVALFNTPTVPLSPRPFGRFLSSSSTPSSSQPSASIDVPLPQHRAKFFASELSSKQHSSPASLGRKESFTGLDAPSRPPFSRFSIDEGSMNEGANNRTTTSLALNPVKNIKSQRHPYILSREALLPRRPAQGIHLLNYRLLSQVFPVHQVHPPHAL